MLVPFNRSKGLTSLLSKLEHVEYQLLECISYTSLNDQLLITQINTPFLRWCCEGFTAPTDLVVSGVGFSPLLKSFGVVSCFKMCVVDFSTRR